MIFIDYLYFVLILKPSKVFFMNHDLHFGAKTKQLLWLNL